MKYLVILLFLQGGSQKEIVLDSFKTENEAKSYRVLLFDNNRKYYKEYEKRGIYIPRTWTKFDSSVIIREESYEKQ